MFTGFGNVMVVHIQITFGQTTNDGLIGLVRSTLPLPISPTGVPVILKSAQRIEESPRFPFLRNATNDSKSILDVNQRNTFVQIRNYLPLFHATSASSVQRLPAELLFFVGAKKSNQKKAPCAKKIAARPYHKSLPQIQCSSRRPC